VSWIYIFLSTEAKHIFWFEREVPDANVASAHTNILDLRNVIDIGGNLDNVYNVGAEDEEPKECHISRLINRERQHVCYDVTHDQG
jgi:hypothetical protein